jgi:hypothetical protein
MVPGSIGMVCASRDTLSDFRGSCRYSVILNNLKPQNENLNLFSVLFNLSHAPHSQVDVAMVLCNTCQSPPASERCGLRAAAFWR